MHSFISASLSQGETENQKLNLICNAIQTIPVEETVSLVLHAKLKMTISVRSSRLRNLSR